MKVVKITGDNTTTKPLNQNRMKPKEKSAASLYCIGCLNLCN